MTCKFEYINAEVNMDSEEETGRDIQDCITNFEANNPELTWRTVMPLIL